MRAASRAAISRPSAPQGGINVFEAAAAHIEALQAARQARDRGGWSEGSAERMGGVLADHGLAAHAPVADWPDALKLDASARGRRACSASSTASRRRISPSSPSRTFSATAWCARDARIDRAQNFLAEASSLAPGDLVTHIEHGVGRYVGLQTIDVRGRAARLPGAAI